MEFLQEYAVGVILGICLCVGYVIHQWINDVDNKYIPTIVAVVGIVMNMWLNGWALTPVILLQGLISGLSSTGLYELFKQFLGKPLYPTKKEPTD